jgi:hypothetical protein
MATGLRQRVAAERCGHMLPNGQSAACRRPVGHHGAHMSWPDNLLPPQDWKALGFTPGLHRALPTGNTNGTGLGSQVKGS